MKKVFIIFIFFMCINNVYADNSLSLKAKSAITIESSTNNILYEHNVNERLAPASMTKMMSLLLIMEAIEHDVIKYTDKITISHNAASMGGSQILLEEGEVMSVDDLIKGVAVASANDAVVALAEKIAGTEENFVTMMNKKVKELKLSNTQFKNCHGLDEEGHYSSAYDMAIIASELVKHKKIFDYTTIYETYLRKGTKRQIWLVNTNKLIRFKQGVDGLKTGYTKDSLYCLTATMMKDNMRVISVVMGESDSGIRNTEVSSLLDYAFSNFGINKLYSKDDIVDIIDIDKYNIDRLKIYASRDVASIYNKMNGKNKLTYKIEYNNIDNIKDNVVGNLILLDNNKKVDSIPLIIKDDIKRLNFISLFVKYLKDTIRGNICVK